MRTIAAVALSRSKKCVRTEVSFGVRRCADWALCEVLSDFCSRRAWGVGSRNLSRASEQVTGYTEVKTERNAALSESVLYV